MRLGKDKISQSRFATQYKKSDKNLIMQIWKINETMMLYEETKSSNRIKLRHIPGKNKNEQ